MLPAPEVLAKETYAYIIEHPEEHDQGVWWRKKPFCGTTACFAGHAVHIAYPDAKFKRDGFVEIDGEGRSIPDLAQDLLDLSFFQANALFYSSSIEAIHDHLTDWGML